MYRRPKFLTVLHEIRETMSREADYDVDLFAEMVRSGARPQHGPARNIRGQALADWLDSDIDFLNGGNPLDELAAGGYERLIQLALGLTHSVFT